MRRARLSGIDVTIKGVALEVFHADLFNQNKRHLTLVHRLFNGTVRGHIKRQLRGSRQTVPFDSSVGHICLSPGIYMLSLAYLCITSTIIKGSHIPYLCVDLQSTITISVWSTFLTSILWLIKASHSAFGILSTVFCLTTVFYFTLILLMLALKWIFLHFFFLF